MQQQEGKQLVPYNNSHVTFPFPWHKRTVVNGWEVCYNITSVGKPSVTKYTNLFQMFVGVEEGCCANSGRSKSDLFVSVYDEII